jgi:plasmid replication DNA-binding protein KfrA
METTDGRSASFAAGTLFQVRKQALEARVAEVAKALHERGIVPTVARVRSALGGGSPNDLAPALKVWKESVSLSASSPARGEPIPTFPLQLAHLVHELWQGALAAATVQVKGGVPARDVAARTGEMQVLRDQVGTLRDQLQREALAYGELRAQSARHEAIAQAALARADASDSRERGLLREIGGLRQRISELEAQLEQFLVAEIPKGRIGGSAAGRRKQPTVGAKMRRLKRQPGSKKRLRGSPRSRGRGRKR